MRTIKPDDLARTIAEQMEAFAGSTEDAVLAAINETAKEAAEVVRSKARQEFGDNYAQDIQAITARKIQRNGGTAYVTAGDHYRVAHLLEHGHAIVAGGRRLSKRVEGREHFADGERYADEHIVQNIRKEMNT